MSKEKGKKKTGRPGQYVKWLTDEGLTLVRGWAMDGLSNAQIAKNMGIHESTFYSYQEKFPEFKEAVKKGKEVVDREVENAMHKSALGYEVVEEKTYVEEVNGKIKKRKEITKKYIPPNTAAQIFWLKNRKPNQWKDRKDFESEEEEIIIVNDIKELGSEE